MTEDPRAEAKRALGELRDSAVCGHCRNDYETMIDALDADGEFETLMREYVKIHEGHIRESHPKAADLRERAGEIREARDEVAKRLSQGQPAPTPPAPPPTAAPVQPSGPVAPRVERPLGRMLGDPLGLRSVIAPWRRTLGDAIPRPLREIRRGRTGGRR